MSTGDRSTHDELKDRARAFAQRVDVGTPSMRTIERAARRHRTRRRRRVGLGLAAAVSVVVGAVSVLGQGSGPVDGGNDESIEDVAGSIEDVAVMMQRVTSYDFDPLSAQGRSLEDLADASAVVGRGRLVDVRLGYSIDYGKFADGTPVKDRKVLLVIEPSELTKGKDQLGSSGLVFVAQPWSDAYDLDAFRSGATSSGGEVAFFLTPVVFDQGQQIAEEFAGRERDDPVYVPSHPSALLAMESSSGSAFPLLTDEQIKASPVNLEAMADIGAQVDRFTVVTTSHTHGVPGPSQPEEPETPPDED